MFTVHPIDPAAAARLRAGGPDAHGNPAERAVSNGAHTPCRHCLHDVPAGAEMLIAAHCPFAGRHPYAEIGPIFSVRSCLPALVGTRSAAGAWGLTRLPDEGLWARRAHRRRQPVRVVAAGGIAAGAVALLARSDIAFVDIRSARNNCWLARIGR